MSARTSDEKDRIPTADGAAAASADDSDVSSESNSGVFWTPEEEKQLMRKVDWTLLPGLTLLYLLSFLDRSNVGNARAYGMLTDIGATDPNAYNNGLALFFVAYVLFEIPAQIVLKKLNPKIWLPTLTIAFGVVATLQGLVRDTAGFYAGRFFLGVSEAGLFPGVVFVFSLYYRRNERHWRVAVFFGGAALAGAFGGVLAWAIGHIKVAGQPSWAWIFYIEGIVTVLIGVSAYWWVPTYAHDAKFLNERERAILLARLRADSDAANVEKLDWNGVWDAFKDYLVIGYGALFHGFAFPLYSLSLFLPTIIQQLGYASWKAQLMTVPCYAAAFFGILFFAWASAYTNRRGAWIAIAGAVAIIGYIVLLTTHSAADRYGGAIIAVFGIYCGNALLLAWPSENVSPISKRAVSGGMQIFLGDIGAIAGVLVYRPSLKGNFYRLPHIAAIIYTAFGSFIALALWFAMHRINKKRDAITGARSTDASGAEKALDAVQQQTKEERPNLGDRDVNYRFQI